MKSITETSKTMTSKEIAEVLGVKAKLVIDTGKRLYPSRVKNGITTHWSEIEVTEITKSIKANIGKGNSNIPFIQTKGLPSTQLEVLERAGNALKDLMGVIADMKAEADIANSRVIAVESENRMLRHQVEYNEVIGCSRWIDVKKLLDIKEKWDAVRDCLDLEENVDFFKKCMGYDKFPTIMLPDSTVAKIKECFWK